MFRDMRRSQQHLTVKEMEDILDKRTAGVLAVSGDQGYPYAVPLSYVYSDNTIYFHSATAGHKIDGIKNNDKVSFCVVDQDHIVPEDFTTHFRSVIAFGKARIVEEIDEKRKSLILLSQKYSPEMDKEIMRRTSSTLEGVAMVAIDIEHMTGKEALEMAKMKGKSQDNQ